MTKFVNFNDWMVKPNKGSRMKHKEECGCCYGTGICTDIEGSESACMTCNGKGYFEWNDEDFCKNDCTSSTLQEENEESN